MILHPGILALLLASFLAMLMLLYASAIGVVILRKWDLSSSSARQLALERKTRLVSTLVSHALGFVLFSGLLYVYTVDDIHELFVGAMCAVGSLNANPVGWNVLGTKFLLFFLAAVWLAVNFFDQRAEDFPLVKMKYLLLLLIVPVASSDFFLQAGYFLGLHPEIITSCCGSLFSAGDSTVAAELAGLPVRPMMWLFYLLAALYLSAGSFCLLSRAAFARYLAAILAALFFPAALAAVVSFISIYVYELPTHHCPFDILQKEYHFIGYPLYISLLCGVLLGILPGIFQPLKKKSSLTGEIGRAEKKWLVLSMLAILGFTLLSSWPVWFGNLTLEGY